MKRPFYLIFFVAILFSCERKKFPDTDIGVAKEFIIDLHKGDFKEAGELLLPEPNNQQYLDRYKEFFKTWPKDKKEFFENTDVLIIDEISPVTDSVTIVNYTTNYKKEEKNKVKVVKLNGRWLVDFKYTFSGNL